MITVGIVTPSIVTTIIVTPLLPAEGGVTNAFITSEGNDFYTSDGEQFTLQGE